MADIRGFVKLGMPSNQRPEMRDLSRFLTEYCTMWRTIGLKLGLQDSLLDMIESEHPLEVRDRFRRTLQYWLKQDVSATWSTLEFAITNARRDELSLPEVPAVQQLNSQEEEQGDCHNGASSLMNLKENDGMNVLIVGISGHGKSTLSNFILQEDVFQSGFGFIPVSKKAEKQTKTIQGINFSIIDTVGFSDGPGLQEHHLSQISDALEIFSGGINAILFVIKSTERFTINASSILTDLQELSDIWDHCFVVFTNIRALASTESKQLYRIQQMLADASCPESLTSLMRMVNNRYMVVESVIPMGGNYYLNKVDEMIKMIKQLKTEPYTNKMFKITFSKYKEAKEKVEISEARLLEQQQSLEVRLKQVEEEREKEKQEREKEEKERQEKEKQEREERERQERDRLQKEREEEQRRKEEEERIYRHKKKQKHNRRQRRQLGRF